MTLLLLWLFSFCFDWEVVSNTRDSISSAIQTPRIHSNILRCASYFQLGYPDETLSLVFDILPLEFSQSLGKDIIMVCLPRTFHDWLTGHDPNERYIYPSEIDQTSACAMRSRHVLRHQILVFVMKCKFCSKIGSIVQYTRPLINISRLQRF